MSCMMGSDACIYQNLPMFVPSDLRVVDGVFIEHCLPPCLSFVILLLGPVEGDRRCGLVATATRRQKYDRWQQVETAK